MLTFAVDNQKAIAKVTQDLRNDLRKYELNEDEWDALVPEFLNVWDPEKAVVVYCDGGGCEASHDVANRLRRDFAIETVYVLKGGYPAWRSN